VNKIPIGTLFFNIHTEELFIVYEIKEDAYSVWFVGLAAQYQWASYPIEIFEPAVLEGNTNGWEIWAEL
jgi:hypothetical protein